MFDDTIRALTRAPYRSLPRMALDLGVWSLIGGLAATAGHPLAWAAAVAAIGVGPAHDLLFHAHEGAHGNLSRTRWVNEAASTAVHALFGLSGAGYRAFHLRHHRFAHTARDPERLLAERIATVSRHGAPRTDLVGPGAPGWAWLLVPVFGVLPTTVDPLFRPGRLRQLVVRDLAAIAIVHGALIAALGVSGWLAWVVAPLVVVAPVAAIRGITEHVGLPDGETRGMEVGPVLGFLWSNASYHVEHHLFPKVPYHCLPAVRAHLRDRYAAEGTALDDGYLRTASRLARLPTASTPSRAAAPKPPPLVRRASPVFRLRVALFRDVLACKEARTHLFRVYYTGEAYTELHPDGLFAGRLPARLGRRLVAHLADETRHAEVFRALLARDGAEPVLVRPVEDVGWHGLTSAVPEVVTPDASPFPRLLAMRYFAFLHALELRSIGDLHALGVAAAELADREVADGVERILRDERRHAAYALTAVHDLASSRSEARAVLAEVTASERAAYARSVRAIFGELARRGAAGSSSAGRARWALLSAALASGGATPPLPIYDRLPHPLAA